MSNPENSGPTFKLVSMPMSYPGLRGNRTNIREHDKVTMLKITKSAPASMGGGSSSASPAVYLIGEEKCSSASNFRKGATAKGEEYFRWYGDHFTLKVGSRTITARVKGYTNQTLVFTYKLSGGREVEGTINISHTPPEIINSIEVIRGPRKQPHNGFIVRHDEKGKIVNPNPPDELAESTVYKPMDFNKSLAELIAEADAAQAEAEEEEELTPISVGSFEGGSTPQAGSSSATGPNMPRNLLPKGGRRTNRRSKRSTKRRRNGRKSARR